VFYNRERISKSTFTPASVDRRRSMHNTAMMKHPFGTNDDAASNESEPTMRIDEKPSTGWRPLANESENLEELELDSILAQELNRMNLKQRELLYEEIHGVDEIVHETPHFLNEKLVAFEYAIRCISQKPAYELAAEISPQFVSDLRFRLMFLRVEDAFDANKAAMRCVNYMEEKHSLFGTEPLTRRLFLSDLSENDMVCLKSGALQVLPQRDRAGRPLMGNFRNLIPRCYKEVNNMVGSVVGRNFVSQQA
jgi:hypothetical protein